MHYPSEILKLPPSTPSRPPTFELFDAIRRLITTSHDLSSLCDAIQQGHKPQSWHVQDGLITRNGHVFIPASSDLV